MTQTDKDAVIDGIIPFVIYYILIGVVLSVLQFLSYYLLLVSGERFTERLRVQLFGAMLRQEISWFDRQDNTLGSLSARLSVDPTEVNK